MYVELVFQLAITLVITILAIVIVYLSAKLLNYIVQKQYQKIPSMEEDQVKQYFHKQKIVLIYGVNEKTLEFQYNNTINELFTYYRRFRLEPKKHKNKIVLKSDEDFLELYKKITLQLVYSMSPQEDEDVLLRLYQEMYNIILERQVHDYKITYTAEYTEEQ